jgi:hypothetical protein
MNGFNPPQIKGGLKEGKAMTNQPLSKLGGDPYGIATNQWFQLLTKPTPKKRALFSLINKKRKPNLFASLGIHPAIFVLQSLAVVAFAVGLYAAVIIAAALMGVL